MATRPVAVTSPKGIFEALSSSDVIRDWPKVARMELSQLSRVSYRARGALLHRHGEPESRFYVLVEGAVEFSRVLPDGRNYVLPYVAAGQPFGLAAVLAKQPSLFDVRTRVDSTLLWFPREELRGFLLDRPELLISISAALSRRFSRVYEQLEILSSMSLRQRLARALLDLAAAFGRPAVSGIELSLRVAQDDLAAMVAASRQRVNVEFRAMATQGILSSTYGRITIANMARLHEIAGRTSTESDPA